MASVTFLPFCPKSSSAACFNRTRCCPSARKRRKEGPKMARKSLRLLSWNTDMDTPPIAARARSLLRQIRLLKPDLVMLQEVTAETMPILKAGLQPKLPPKPSDADPAEAPEAPPMFDLHIDPSWPGELPYFPALFTRAGLFTTSGESTAVRFVGSRMHRGYIAVRGELAESGVRATVVTSHLESLKEGAAQRKDQLARIFDLLRADAREGSLAVFAGDTNLREAEVSARDVYKTEAAERARQGLEEPHVKKRRRTADEAKFIDAWLAAGADPEDKFTWDMRENDNLGFGADFKPRARYDRVFLLPGDGNRIEVKHWKLVGKERMAYGKFVSDHWGVCVDLEVGGKVCKDREGA